MILAAFRQVSAGFQPAGEGWAEQSQASSQETSLGAQGGGTSLQGWLQVAEGQSVTVIDAEGLTVSQPLFTVTGWPPDLRKDRADELIGTSTEEQRAAVPATQGERQMPPENVLQALGSASD